MRTTNNRTRVIITALIASILPAVAVADVMIDGYAPITGSANSVIVMALQPGPNYSAAHQAGALDLNSVAKSGTNTFGAEIILNGVDGASTELLDVLDFNLTLTQSLPGTLLLNFTFTASVADAQAMLTSMYIGVAPSSTMGLMVPLTVVQTSATSYSGYYQTSLDLTSTGLTTYLISFSLGPYDYAGMTGEIRAMYS